MTSNRHGWWNQNARIVVAVLATFILCCIGGCGGGTTGSDGGVTIKIGGIVEDATGTVLPGVMVTVLQTGDSTVSDETGQFSVDTELPGNEAQLLFESTDFTAQTTVQTIPQNAETVTARFRIDTASDTVEVREVVVQERSPSVDPAANPSTRPDDTEGNRPDTGAIDSGREPPTATFRDDDRPNGTSIALPNPPGSRKPKPK